MTFGERWEKRSQKNSVNMHTERRVKELILKGLLQKLNWLDLQENRPSKRTKLEIQ